MSIALSLPELLLKYNTGSQVEQCPIVDVILAHLRTLLGTSQKQQLEKSLTSLQPQRRLTNTGEVTHMGALTTASLISDFGASQVIFRIPLFVYIAELFILFCIIDVMLYRRVQQREIKVTNLLCVC